MQSGDVEVERLLREPLKLALALDHPLSGGSKGELADMEGQDDESTSLNMLHQITVLNMGLSFLPALYVRSEVLEDMTKVVFGGTSGGF